eukprot:jgi/Psemu1/24859/gm1.24859_g
MTMNAPLDNKIWLARTSRLFDSSQQQNRSLLSVQLDLDLHKQISTSGMEVKYKNKPIHSHSHSHSQDSATTYSLASSTSYCSVSSSGSDSSVSSQLSTSTESLAAIEPEPELQVDPKLPLRNCQRRKIFSQYWQKNQLPTSPIAALSRNTDPKSPLIQHYPSSSGSSGGGSDVKQSSSSSIHPSTKSSLHPSDATPATARREPSTTKSLSVSPARRSIFGARHQHDENEKETFEVESFLSRHEHMTVLSASFDSTNAMFPPPKAQMHTQTQTQSHTQTQMKMMRRQMRRYSCSDAMPAFAAGSHSKTTSTSATRLTSCLRRSRSSVSGDNSGAVNINDNNNNNNTHSVTFDSQISVISFEPTTSCNVECYSDGSWTDVFDH